jgi:hypothetical protein
MVALPNRFNRSVTQGAYNLEWADVVTVPKRSDLLRPDSRPTEKDTIFLRTRRWWSDAKGYTNILGSEPLPKGHPLWKFENVIITPHVAGRSDKENERYSALFKENLRRFATGEPLLNVVDKQKGY